jgi:hypothetical protein
MIWPVERWQIGSAGALDSRGPELVHLQEFQSVRTLPLPNTALVESELAVPGGKRDFGNSRAATSNTIELVCADPGVLRYHSARLENLLSRSRMQVSVNSG